MLRTRGERDYIGVAEAASRYGMPRGILDQAMERGELHRHRASGYRLSSKELRRWMLQWAA